MLALSSVGSESFFLILILYWQLNHCTCYYVPKNESQKKREKKLGSAFNLTKLHVSKQLMLFSQDQGSFAVNNSLVAPDLLSLEPSASKDDNKQSHHQLTEHQKIVLAEERRVSPLFIISYKGYRVRYVRRPII